MSGRCHSVVIGGTGSGVGKTSLALGLARAMSRRGLRVATFKVGPDFLDPTYLALASGGTCYNLDGWMTGQSYVKELFAGATADADVAIVEGVMGLFDGAAPDAIDGSTAEIAAWLAAPVLLVVNVHGVARSLAATVKGFAEFEPRVRLAGVIANQSGSDSHRATLQRALVAAGLPPLLGAIPRGAMPTLASRHLGLVTADADVLPEAIIDQLADACEKHVDVQRILDVAGPGSPACASGVVGPGSLVRASGVVGTGSLACALPPKAAKAPAATAAGGQAESLSLHEPKGGGSRVVRPIVIGVARDAAFHFYYPDNLDLLRAGGAELLEFSPLADLALPENLDGLYLGGGYPEVFAEPLAANQAMLAAVRRFAESGRPVYAECGGLIYLGRSVRTLDGRRHALAGVLPIDTAMQPRLKTLGYVRVEPLGDRPIFAGPVRGHEFHYSEIVANDSTAGGWGPAWSVQRRRDGGGSRPEGFRRGGVVASYVHVHLGSRPTAADEFVRAFVVGTGSPACAEEKV